ncbi:MAG: hypothetical protein M1548_01945 [Actinobacteria bacterium]|nr:hypothetical protein [Actinomycetota bacterium]
MAQLNPQSMQASGLSPTYVAAAGGGDSFANDGNTFFHVKNGGAGAIDVTIASAKTCNQGGTHALVVNVPAGQERMIGRLSADRFNDANGLVQVTYSGVTSVTVAAVKMA